MLSDQRMAFDHAMNALKTDIRGFEDNVEGERSAATSRQPTEPCTARSPQSSRCAKTSKPRNSIRPKSDWGGGNDESGGPWQDSRNDSRAEPPFPWSNGISSRS